MAAPVPAALICGAPSLGAVVATFNLIFAPLQISVAKGVGLGAASMALTTAVVAV